MANTRFAQDGLVSAKLDRRSTTPEFALGTVAIANNGTVFVYGLASEVVATGTCTLNASTFAITDTAGLHTADVAFASGQYGFVRKTVSPFLADPA
jgi:hypothetical protein